MIGDTSPEPEAQREQPAARPDRPPHVEDMHATILHALGIDFTQEIMTPIGRPMAFSKGKVIDELLT